MKAMSTPSSSTAAKRSVTARRFQEQQEQQNTDTDLDDLDSPSKRTQSESPTTLRCPGLISSTTRFAPCTANLTSPMAVLHTLPGLSNGGAKAMKDSLSEIKSITSLLQKSLGHIENDLLQSI
jgi:hypothetical protein